MPTATLVFESNFANIDTQGVGQPAGDEAPVAPVLAVGVGLFPTQERRDLAFGEFEEFVDDRLRIEWIENFAVVALPVLFRRDGVKPGTRIELRVLSKVALPAWHTPADADAAVAAEIEFREPARRRDHHWDLKRKEPPALLIGRPFFPCIALYGLRCRDFAADFGDLAWCAV